MLNEPKFGDVAVTVPPGVSWTDPPKGRPWSQPPKLTKLYDVANHYLGVMSSVDIANELLDALETEVPLSSIAEGLMLTNVSRGMHTLDAGILVLPVIIELLETVAEVNNIKTVKFASELSKNTVAPKRVVQQVMQQVKESVTPSAEIDEPAGLMARKKKEGI
jgi:hypothetical protein